MKKQGIAILLTLCLLLPLGGCGAAKDDGKLTVVCTVFPLYDWVRAVVGASEAVEVILLVQNGTDLHSYQPTAEDIVRLRSCDLLIRLGGTADGWVEDALEKAPSANRVDLRLTELETVILREISAESVAGDHGHRHDHGAHDSNEECVVDEHIWLSLPNARASVRAIAEALAELDVSGAETYRLAAERYAEELTALDVEYRAMMAEAAAPYLLVADRFPFVYLAEEYGIGYLAAYEGCSTESDADADTVIRLAEELNRRDLRFVVVTESADETLAKGVIRASARKDQTVVVLDSLQSVTAKQIEEGKTYLNTMQSNLTVLRRVLLP